MRLKKSAGSVLWTLIKIGIGVLTIIGYIKGIFISLDIDESYALTQSYRLAMGEKMFVDMWEAHQLSAFMSALFIKGYLLILQTTDYLVIYLRIVAMLIHVGIGYWLYYSLQSVCDKNMRFILLFLHLNFYPKWVQMPEFELMHYWFLLAVFLLLHQYFVCEKSHFWQPLLAGMCLVGSMMSYPTMILLYPIYVFGLCMLEKLYRGVQGVRRLQSSFWFTLGAGGIGFAFLMYLFSYQTIDEFLQNIAYVFMDESHTTYTMAEKWLMYGQEAQNLFDDYMESAKIAIVIAVVIVFVLGMIGKSYKNSFPGIQLKEVLEKALLFILILTAILLQKDHIVGCLLQDENQFFMQLRYLAAILPAIYLGIRYYKKMAIYLWLCVLPALLSLPAALLITNMNVNVACSRIVLGIWGSLLMLHIYVRTEADGKEAGVLAVLEKASVYLLGISLLVGFFVCRLVLIRVTGCLPVTIKAPLDRMEYGAEKGVYILEEQARIWNENYSILQQIIDKEERLLYIGAENLIYPAMGCTLSTPSTQGTTVFNEIFLNYYREHEERVPSVVVIDKTFSVNPVYELFSNTDIIMQWINENYSDIREYETSYMKILLLED